LAKKHHPDVVAGRTTSEKEISSSDKIFKEVTEAYAILSDEKLRKKYDRLIFGDSADNREFENEEAYQYWSSKQEPSKVKEEYEEMQEKIKERLKNFTDYNDFLRNFENHRDKNEERSYLMREEGWKDLNDKYDSTYKFF
jgi:curved DNA-binding protein